MIALPGREFMHPSSRHSSRLEALEGVGVSEAGEVVITKAIDPFTCEETSVLEMHLNP
jgi:hypothetical protein